MSIGLGEELHRSCRCRALPTGRRSHHGWSRLPRLPLRHLLHDVDPAAHLEPNHTLSDRSIPQIRWDGSEKLPSFVLPAHESIGATKLSASALSSFPGGFRL